MEISRSPGDCQGKHLPKLAGAFHRHGKHLPKLTGAFHRHGKHLPKLAGAFHRHGKHLLKLAGAFHRRGWHLPKLAGAVHDDGCSLMVFRAGIPSGCGGRGGANRWCRCAQPPATGWDACRHHEPGRAWIHFRRPKLVGKSAGGVPTKTARGGNGSRVPFRIDPTACPVYPCPFRQI